MVQLIDDLTKWLQKNVCDELELKKPSIRGDSSYEYELVKPTAFPCFCMPQDKSSLPSSPSVTVQIDSFSDDITNESTANIALVFSVWNTGVHGKAEDGTPTFEKNLDGWRDLWRFMDRARTEIRERFSVAGYEVKSEIKGRPLSGESAIMGTYPYFFGEITFTIGNIKSVDTAIDIRKLL